MIVMFRRRRIGISPILIGSYKEYNAPNNYVIPNGHSHVVVAIQKGVDKREKSKRCDKPICHRNFLTPPRHKAAEGKGRNPKPQ